MQGKRTKNEPPKVYEWSHKEKVEFNAEKCHVIEFVTSGKRPDFKYIRGNNSLQVSEKGKDLGVIINNKLSLGHINEK